MAWQKRRERAPGRGSNKFKGTVVGWEDLKEASVARKGEARLGLWKAVGLR